MWILIEVSTSTQSHTRQTEADRAGAVYLLRRKFSFLWRGSRNVGPGYGTTSDYKVYMYDRSSCGNWSTCGIHSICESYIWATELQNKQSDLCAQRRLRLTRAYAQSDQSLRTMGSWGPNVSSCGQRRLWSDWAGVQTESESSLGAEVILLVRSYGGSYKSESSSKTVINSVSSQCARGKSSVARKNGPKIFKW